MRVSDWMGGVGSSHYTTCGSLVVGRGDRGSSFVLMISGSRGGVLTTSCSITLGGLFISNCSFALMSFSGESGSASGS